MDEAAKDLRALRFVADMTRKLAKMLSRTRYHMLVYFLEMTAVEAESRERLRRFLARPTGYQPGNARMFHD